MQQVLQSFFYQLKLKFWPAQYCPSNNFSNWFFGQLLHVPIQPFFWLRSTRTKCKSARETCQMVNKSDSSTNQKHEMTRSDGCDGNDHQLLFCFFELVRGRVVIPSSPHRQINNICTVHYNKQRRIFDKERAMSIRNYANASAKFLKFNFPTRNYNRQGMKLI